MAATLSACTGSSGGGDAPPSVAAIDTALAAHAKAVRDRDRSAFLSGLDPARAASSYRSRQLAEFANLRHVPLTTWTLRVSAQVKDAAGPQATARRTFGAGARIVRVTLRYAIAGVDPVPTSHELWLTVARVDGQVVLCADDGLARQGGVSWRGPWDFGPMTVVHGRHCLVLGRPADTPTLRRIATAVDADVPAVTSVWGTHWARDVAVVVPSTDAALQAAVGDTDASLKQTGTVDVDAVAVNDGQDPLTGQVEGQRIVLTTESFDDLSALGRHVVLTHEITHVASAAATGGASPRWLVEGFAEYVAYRGVDQPVRDSARELVTQVRNSGVPTALPDDTVFDDTGLAAAAYEQSWLACRLVAAKAGVAGLVRFYRLVGQSGMDTATAVQAATRAVLHESTAGFVRQWRAYLRDTVG